MTPSTNRIPSSFRDPSGFLFTENCTLFRSVSRRYRQDYDHLTRSGLYDKLIENKLLIPHEEVDPGTIEHFPGSIEDIYKIIQPERVSFVSYPYEWCFSQLKDAALTTIKIQKQALDHGMVLKDASAYNVQFYKGVPLLIDTLSFEIYQENQPWVAYRQFCQHFLAPLGLMSSLDIRLNQLMRIYIDGLPLDLASGLLPIFSWLKPVQLTHIHLHAKAQKRYGKSKDVTRIEQNSGSCPRISLPSKPKRKVTKQSLIALIHHLENAVAAMQWQPAGTEWADYYEDTNYSTAAMNHKKQLVDAYLKEIKPLTVWDLGANTGVFSCIAAANNAETIAFDVDPAAVEKNYRQTRENKETKILPLCMDLTNPSPSIGWANEERLSLVERGPADVILALALIHHLAISNNLPFDHIANFLSRVCKFLVIEFVSKKDSQVQRLLCNREDIFNNYKEKDFEDNFNAYFSILKKSNIGDTKRVLYLMQNRDMK